MMKLNLTILTWTIALVVLCQGPSFLVAQDVQQEYSLAAGYYSRGQWNEALVAFDNLIASSPNSDEAVAARFFASEVRIQTGDFANAYLGFQDFLRRFPGHEFSDRAMFRMGEAAYRSKRYGTAIRVLESFMRDNPGHELNEFALAYLGQMRLQQNEPQLAQRVFEFALKQYPDSTLSNRCRLGLAKSLQQQGNFVEAKRFFGFLKDLDDPDMCGEANLQLGIMSFSDGRFEDSKGQLEIARERCQSANSNAEAIYWLSRIRNQNEEFAEALELLENAIGKATDGALGKAILFDAAISATRLGDTNKALKLLEQLREFSDDRVLDDNALVIAIDLVQDSGDEKKLLELIAEFREHHKMSPNRSAILEIESRLHYEQKRFHEAVATLGLVIDENRDADLEVRSRWHYLKSLAYIGLAKFDKAEKELDHVGTELSPEMESLATLTLATAQFGQGKFRSAGQQYQRYLELNPESSESRRARTELLVCLTETEQWDEAGKAIKNLTEQYGTTDSTLKTTRFVAEKAYELGNYELAKSLFTILAEKGNPNEMIARGLSGLAWIQMETENSKDAFELFDRLLIECPDSKFSGEAAMARAKFFEDQNDLKAAAEMYGLVIRRFNDSEMVNVARLRRAYAMQEMGGKTNLKEADRLLEDYAKADSPALHGEAIYQRAWVLFDLGNKAAAYEQFELLVSGFPDCKYWPDAAYRLIQKKMADGQSESAKPLIEKLIGRSDVPDEVVSRVLFIKGQIAAKDEAWEQVAPAMSRLVATTNDAVLKNKARYWLGESYYRQLKFELSLESLQQIEFKQQDSLKSLEPWIQLRIAQSLARLKRWEEAADVSAKAKQSNPEFKSNYEFDFVAARAKESEGLLTDARALYQQVVDSEHGRQSETAAIAQWRIGETFFHQEKYVEAIEAYYRVDSLYSFASWRSAALMQAGKCQEHLAHPKHAIKLYMQLLDNFPSSKYAEEAKKRMARLKLLVSKKSTSTNTKSR